MNILKKYFLLLTVFSGLIVLFFTGCTQPNIENSVVVDSEVKESYVTISIINPSDFTDAVFSFEGSTLNTKPLIIKSLAASAADNNIVSSLIVVNYGDMLLKVKAVKDNKELALFEQSYVITEKTTTINVTLEKVEENITVCEKPVFRTPEGEYSINEDFNVIIENKTEGSVIYYTVNDVAPDTGSEIYEDAGIPLVGLGIYEIKAIAVKEGLTSSELVTATFIISERLVVAPVAVTPEEGTYSALAFTGVTLSVLTPDAIIKYTVDGTEPDDTSLTYTKAITLNEGVTTIKARAYKEGFDSSPICVSEYTIVGAGEELIVSDPVVVASGVTPYTIDTDFTITCSTANASIYYTTNGSEPTTSSTKYTKAFKLSVGTQTVKAIACKDAYKDSNIVSVEYQIANKDLNTVIKPVVTASDVEPYTIETTFEITSATAGAVIRYTTDNTDPTSLSPIYTKAFSLEAGAKNIRAIAFLDGYNTSEIVSVNYTIEDIVQDKVAAPVIVASGSAPYTADTLFSISCVTSGAVVYYTIDGVKPTKASSVYKAPFTLGIGTQTVKAIALKDTFLDSDVTSTEYVIINKDLETVSTPKVAALSPAPYTKETTFQITSVTAGAIIRYTTDNTQPTSTSPVYLKAFTMEAGVKTIKAIAFLTGYNPSAIASVEYTITEDPKEKVITPVITASNSSPYLTSTTFSISTQTAGAVIKYTFDGSDPTDASLTYNNAFSLAKGTKTIKAIAFKDGFDSSEIASVQYIIVDDVKPQVATPQISLSGSTPYNVTTGITITTATAGATIYYTVDGTTPTAASAQYSVAFTLPADGTYTIKAIGVKADMTDSSVASKNVVIVTPYDGVVIYVKSTTAPTIWIWETTGTKIECTKAMGFTWDTQPVMVAATGMNDATGWFKFEIPSANVSGGALSFILNKGSTITSTKTATFWYDNGTYSDTDPSTPVGPVLPEVTATPGTSSFTTSTSVVLAVSPSMDIYYTLDGSDPTTASSVYGSAIALTATTTLKTMVTDGTVTDINSFIYTLSGPQAPLVTASPGSKTFETSVSVVLAVNPTVTIHYTIDGSVPTVSSPAYSTALSFTETTTLKTYVEKDGVSEVKTFTYTKGAVSAYYATNPNGQVGTNKTVTALTDWSEDMKIAQGAANDCARSWLGFHEYPDPDLYAMYAAWDSTNLYLMVEMPNLDDADTIDNDKSYAGSQFLPMGWAINTGKRTAGNGLMADGFNVWTKAKVYTFADGIDTLVMHHPRLGIGKPSVFTTDSAGKFGYEPAQCIGFTEAGVVRVPSFNESVSTSMWAGVTATGDLGGKDSIDVTTYDYVDLKLDGKKATSYQITIPLASLGVDKAYIESTGISVAVFTTYGESIMDVLPWDPSMIDNAKTPYSKDPSSSAEKEDYDEINASLARVGKL
ncbi:MAG TPA: hypothetical protein DC057_16495 [Spirochaetia bacterium]|nr:hypothetical protein [Spirochaetia bacterium]